ncbi:MAG: winged helix-turn-helix domain-containing protein [Gammaproteobacteria bacterium]|nr:winged helix-turn-helix domain-containing protein [Gammaproteobacteria bacterium]
MLGEWRVDAIKGELCRGDEVRSLPPQPMAVLLALAESEDHVLTRQQLLDSVWNDRPGADESLTRSIADLRAALGDESGNPRYIRTLPRRGYQLLESPQAAEPATESTTVVDRAWPGLGLLALGIVLLAGLLATLFNTDPFPAGDQRIAIKSLVIDGEAAGNARIDALQRALLDGLASYPEFLVDRSANDEAAAGYHLQVRVTQVDLQYTDLAFMLRIEPDYLVVPVMVFRFPTANWQRIITTDLGRTLGGRLLAAFRPAGEVGNAARQLQPEDFARLLRLRFVAIASTTEGLLAELAEVDALIRQYPDRSSLHGLKAKLVADQLMKWFNQPNTLQEMYELAVEEMNIVLAADPDDVFALAAGVRLRHGAVENVADLERLVELSPYWVQPMIHLADWYENFGYHRREAEIAARVGSLEPMNNQYLYHAVISEMMITQRSLMHSKFRKWNTRSAIAGREDLAMVYAAIAGDPGLLAEYLERRRPTYFRDIDYTVVVDGIFDVDKRSTGLRELRRMEAALPPNQRATTLFLLITMYGETDWALAHYERNHRTLDPKYLWMSFSQHLRMTDRFSTILARDDTRLASLDALEAMLGPNDYCRKQAGRWLCDR